MKIYLAGPEVFHRDAVGIGQKKRALCAKYGFEGLYPIDADAGPPRGDKSEQSLLIFKKNVDLLDAADACIANLSPFKGIDADPGAAWELGYAFAKGKALYGYTNMASELTTRDAMLPPVSAPSADQDLARLFPMQDTRAEDFGRPMNLMMFEAILAAGGGVETAQDKPFHDLDAFERVLERIASA